jgi:hypothetical protein
MILSESISVYFHMRGARLLIKTARFFSSSGLSNPFAFTFSKKSVRMRDKSGSEEWIPLIKKCTHIGTHFSCVMPNKRIGNKTHSLDRRQTSRTRTNTCCFAAKDDPILLTFSPLLTTIKTDVLWQLFKEMRIAEILASYNWNRRGKFRV